MSDRKPQTWLFPKQTGDVGRDRNAWTIQFTCLLFAFVIGVVWVVDTVTGDRVPAPMLVMAIGLLAAAVMNRRGKAAWAARIVILVMLLGAILLVFEAHDGFRSNAPSREVFEQAKRLRPEMKVIVTSAYGKEMAATSLAGTPEHFIGKPYQLGDLMDFVQKSLA